MVVDVSAVVLCYVVIAYGVATGVAVVTVGVAVVFYYRHCSYKLFTYSVLSRTCYRHRPTTTTNMTWYYVFDTFVVVVVVVGVVVVVVGCIAYVAVYAVVFICFVDSFGVGVVVADVIYVVVIVVIGIVDIDVSVVACRCCCC